MIVQGCPQYALCLTCFEVYNPIVFDLGAEYNICPKMSCQNEMILVDENLIPIITELNRKGYHTRNCCSSHTWDQDLYIEFQDDVFIPNDPPIGFFRETTTAYNNHLIPENSVRYTIRAERIGNQNYLEEIPDIERQIKIFENIASLAMWVDKLSNIEEEQE